MNVETQKAAQMLPETKAEAGEGDLELEIAHLLLIDVVNYSTFLVDEQVELMRDLNHIVRKTKTFQGAEKGGRLIRLPTGDGMALLFFQSPEEPVRCALEIGHATKGHSRIQLRMGIHSGPVNEVTDVNDHSNIAGTGINVAQRVMDCGDAGHVLLSRHIAEDLAQYRHWQPHLRDLGECEVKHGLRLHIVNLCKDGVGNPQIPQKLKRGGRWKHSSDSTVRPVDRSIWSAWGFSFSLYTVVLAIVAGSLVFFFHSRPTEPAPESIPKKSIAVLPFQNVSEDKQNVYFIQGVHDEILTDLAKVADLKVISRTSVMPYAAERGRNLREIAKALGVAHILEGTVQRIGSRVRVSAQLIDARTDTHLWAERYDRDIEDVFALESELAERIVSSLEARLSPEEKAAIEEKPTNDLVAYDLYIRGKGLLDAISFDALAYENTFQARELLEQAVARDPTFLLAYVQLAAADDQIYFFGMDHTSERLALADHAVQMALRLDSGSGEAHLARAQHLYWGYRDYDHARQELAIAQSKLPNEPLVFLLAGFIDRRQGRWQRSLDDFEQALRFDPRNLYVLEQLTQSYSKLRRYDDMAAVLDRTMSIAPDDYKLKVYRALIDYYARADLKPLHSAIQSLVTKNPAGAPAISDRWFDLSLCERDPAAAERVLPSLSASGYNDENFVFPPAWCEGLIARLRGQPAAAHKAYTRGRAQVAEIVRQQPAYAEELCVLGLIDAALGRKEEAIREGRRAVELLPISQDSINAPLLMNYLAVIYAWTGEKDLALQELAKAARLPGSFSYGHLTLHPYWDPLRDDPRFKEIIASLAPDAKKP